VLNIPPAINYASPLVSLPTIWDKPPTEGDRIVPCEIDWGIMGGPNNCVNINLFGGAAQTISQICAISVDNSACSADVQFIFSDTNQTYTVKAGTPVATFPVFSNSTQLFVYAPAAQALDVTRFGLLNSMPFPVALPEINPPVETTSATGINLVPVVSSQIIPVAISGVLTGFSISFAFAGAAPILNWSLTDATHTLYAGAVNSAAVGTVVVTENNLQLLFTGGIKFNSSGGAPATSEAVLNLYYTVPTV
jgi:hypothetical protein